MVVGPIRSLFFVSTEMTGCCRARVASTKYREFGFASVVFLIAHEFLRQQAWMMSRHRFGVIRNLSFFSRSDRPDGINSVVGI